MSGSPTNSNSPHHVSQHLLSSPDSRVCQTLPKQTGYRLLESTTQTQEQITDAKEVRLLGSMKYERKAPKSLVFAGAGVLGRPVLNERRGCSIMCERL